MDAELLRSVVDYDACTGLFRWKVRMGQRGKVGGVVGHCGKRGYVLMSIGGVQYRAHRLAWLHAHGQWPSAQIDHVNGIRHDNRLSNLREATSQENAQNLHRANKNNAASGLLGVRYLATRTSPKKWAAGIYVDKKYKLVGYYETAVAAHAAHLRARRAVYLFNTL